MPRSASAPFNYSVPSGTAAVSGAVISSVAYNNFLADLTNNALNAAWPVAYGGTGTTDGSALVPDGGAAAPAVRFQQETNSGFYRVGSGDIGISILSTKVADITASGIFAVSSTTNEAFSNLSLSASVAGSALTIALKTAAGTDPTATNPVQVLFRSATASSGLSSSLTITAATSLVVSSGSTLGTSNGVAATLAVVAFNDAGTFRLGVINPQALPQGIASSTAEGGSGGADSAGVFYTGTAVSAKAYTKLGTITITEATAGTWASGPTAILVSNAQPTISIIRSPQVFLVTGTYTPNANMVYCIIECIGGGGGGGGSNGAASGAFSGGGGGQGSYSRLVASAATIGASKAVTIGAAGGGGPSNANGAAGGDTSVGSLCIGKGGSGGLFGSNIQFGLGGAGGVAGTGDVTPPGIAGGSGFYNSVSGTTIFAASGNGGGGPPGNATGDGTAGSGYGVGGSGAYSAGAVNHTGGSGAGGVVIITEFCSA